MQIEHRNLLLYIAKCVSGCALLFGLNSWLDVDISWVLISMILVLSPDSSEAIPLTIIRVKANLVASAVSIGMLLLTHYMPLAICAALAITIVACYRLSLMPGSRVALAGVIIILLHPQGEHLWSTALERVLSVVVGCGAGLALTFLFHRDIPWNDHVRLFKRTTESAE